MRQMTLAAARGFERHARSTHKAEILARMEGPMPWVAFCALIEPHYPKAGIGRPPVGLERMLRMYCVGNWFNLSDEACEDALFDVPVFREFCRMGLGRERVPNATTLHKFHHLLEEPKLDAALFAKIGELPLANGMKLSGDTIVDAPLIATPSSTKNQDKSRAPEMNRSKKGSEWHFGMKVHIGAESQTGLVHGASVTAANVHDSHQVPNLLHCQETRFYGDSAYRGKEQRKRLKTIAPKAKDFTNKRGYKNRPLTDADKETHRRKSSVRSKVEHPFLTLKRLWGFAKVRYRGLMKNADQTFAVQAILNVVERGRPLTGEVRLA